MSLSEQFTHLPTDYYRGTVYEPESISTLKASFGEYEKLGQQHKEVSSRIDSLREAMKLSRQRGAFQALQNQMKEVKELVKQKEDLDARMAVADLARKKDDDHRIAVQQEVSYSEQLSSVSERINLLAEMVSNFSEFSEEEFDFARCQRPDGSFYGTRGKCKKGTEAGAASKATTTADKKGSGTPSTGGKATVKQLQSQLKERAASLSSMQKQMSSAMKAYGAMEKATKKNPSVENRKNLRLAQKALAQKEREIRKAERETEALRKQWSAARKKLEREKMSPAQLASEKAIDKTIKERG